MALALPGRAGTELVIVLDCLDLDVVAAFWCGALGYGRTGIEEPYCAVRPPPDQPGIELLLQRVNERKSGKNRLHLDIRVDDIDAEAARLVELGARVISDEPIHENGWVWHVLADPEGNEFCVLEPPAEG